MNTIDGKDLFGEFGLLFCKGGYNDLVGEIQYKDYIKHSNDLVDGSLVLLVGDRNRVKERECSVDALIFGGKLEKFINYCADKEVAISIASIGLTFRLRLIGWRFVRQCRKSVRITLTFLEPNPKNRR